ncbi:MAG: prepilin-type N-terminal cleavage/methylation domain-containing protein [Clostridium sp.]|nr:prepilin-type N-terminal cleavage/methylation domain-containing protein [Clostridium sp.]
MKTIVFKKEKGFTLVELLGIMVILAIIALITVPIMRNVIKESEKGTFLETGREIIRSGENYKEVERLRGNRINGCVYFDFGKSIEEETVINGKKYIPISKLSLQGKLPIEGTLKVCEDQIELEVGNGNFVARGDDVTNVVVEEGTIAETDKTPAVIEQIVLNSTTNAIRVIVNAYEEQGIIDKYLYSIDGINYVESKENTYLFEKLISNKEYTIYVKVINKSGLEAKGEKSTSTKEIESPKIEYINTPNEVQNGYLREQIIKVTFSRANISNPQYYVKTTKEGISSIGITESCGTKTTPDTCTTITSTTTLTGGTWYKVSGNINVTYDTESDESGTIYALTYDGTNYSVASTGSIAKIDRTSPSLTLNTEITSSNSITIPYTMSDTGSGLGTPTCKYGTSSNSYDKNATTVDTSKCEITGLSSGTYYYQVCVSDKVGNTSTCKTGQATTGEITKPGIELVNTPTEPQNGYLREQVAKITFSRSNISSPQYFVKTTKQGTSSIGITSSCGTGTTPSTCSSISSTTTLTSNTWYKVSGNINVTYNTESDESGTIYALTYDGTNYSEAATSSITKIDRTSPTVTLQTAATSSNSITIPISKMEDTGSGLGTPTCKYGTSASSYDKNATSVSTNSCEITGLSSGTYYYQVCVNDLVGNTSTCKTGQATTGEITKPGIELVNTPTEPQNGYLREQVVKVTFTSSNITSPQYYVKTTKQGTSSIGVTESCGTSTTPSTCTTITSTTTLSANTWYRISGNINVTYDTESDESGTIYALTYDGTNYSEAATSSITKIDKKEPTVTLGTVTATTTSITIPITEMSDSGSGILSYTCKYGVTEGVYNVDAKEVSTTGCTLNSNLSPGTVYYYQICASDKAGNDSCVKDYWGTDKTVTASNTLASCSSTNSYTSGNYTGTIQLSSSTANYSSWTLKTTSDNLSSCSSSNSSTCASCTSYSTCSSTTNYTCGTWSTTPTTTTNLTSCTTSTKDTTCDSSSSTSYSTCSSYTDYQCGSWSCESTAFLSSYCGTHFSCLSSTSDLPTTCNNIQTQYYITGNSQQYCKRTVTQVTKYTRKTYTRTKTSSKIYTKKTYERTLNNYTCNYSGTAHYKK